MRNDPFQCTAHFQERLPVSWRLSNPIEVNNWVRLSSVIEHNRARNLCEIVTSGGSSPVDRVNSKSESNPSPSQVAESLVSGLFISENIKFAVSINMCTIVFSVSLTNK